MRFLDTRTTVLSPDEVEAMVGRLRAACAGTPIVLLYLHGAHARGTQGPLSDLDLAVLLEADAARDPHAFLALLGKLTDACGREDLDVVLLNRAGLIIKDRVVRDGRLLFAASERERVRFEAHAIKEALDFRYFSRVYDDALFGQLAEGRFLG